MKYRLIIDSGAKRELDKLSGEHRRRIKPILDSLAENPRPQGCEKMTGFEAYRIRIGEYRIVYGVRDQILVVAVVRVGHRREAYREADVIAKRLKKW